MANAIAKLALAESAFDTTQNVKRSLPDSKYRKGCYYKARSVADLARKAAKDARASLVKGEGLSLKETVALAEMAAALAVASVGASQIAKRLYALEFEEDGGESIYDPSKWKGRYTVALYDEDDEPLFFDGPRDMANAFGITVKSAVDRLSSAFPGREGEGKKQLVIHGRKYSVHFVLEDD